MKNKQTISKIRELSSNIKEISNQLFDEKDLNNSDILTITDILEELDQTSQKIQNKSKNIFMKAGAQNISSDIKNIYGKIEEIENKRLLEDEEILIKLHEISYKQDYLELNFSHLNPNEVEMFLESLDEEIEEILSQKPFNENLINPIIDKIKRKIKDLHFRYDFPIIDELDENKNSYAHRLVLLANELKEKDPKKAQFIISKIDELLDLVWISKMFMYGNINNAQNFFDKLNSPIKDKILKAIWKVKGTNLNQLEDDKKWILPLALMNYVADEINA